MTPSITISICPDGNQICAIIGEMPTEDACGFGDNIIEAMVALAHDMMKKRDAGKDWGMPL
jgi:hypothetical protein